jgi:hypothetical protein
VQSAFCLGHSCDGGGLSNYDLGSISRPKGRDFRDFPRSSSIFLSDVVLVLDLFLIGDEIIVPRVFKIMMNVNVIGPP